MRFLSLYFYPASFEAWLDELEEKLPLPEPEEEYFEDYVYDDIDSES